jgi:ubiquinone/menaquinone biosynthesis C-methylase UbiE
VTDLPFVGDERVRDLFDAKASSWSAKYKSDGQMTERLKRFANTIDRHLKSPAHVLDLGCGTGDLALLLASKGLEVTAADVSKEMLTHASAQDDSATVKWVQLHAHWGTLPFDDSSFDAVIASSVLEYIDDIDLVLREIARVVAVGGLVVCTVPDPEHPVRRIESLIAPLARSRVGRRVSERSSRIANYFTYLCVSRHRHTAIWWHGIARVYRLRPVEEQSAERGHPPLRMLIYRRSGRS